MKYGTYKLTVDGTKINAFGSTVSWTDPYAILYVTKDVVGSGTFDVTPMSGIPGTVVSLSNTPANHWKFDHYDITGASITNNTFTFGKTDVNVVCNFVADPWQTVTIGGKKWMNQNLAYSDGGDGIYTENVTVNGVNLGTQYYYTWAAANRVAGKINGWHLPTYSEAQSLYNGAGGSTVAGQRLKSKTGWNSNGNGTDQYGFEGYPCGRRYNSSNSDRGQRAYFWTTSYGDYSRIAFYLSYNVNNFYVTDEMSTSNYLSVRLVKD